MAHLIELIIILMVLAATVDANFRHQPKKNHYNDKLMKTKTEIHDEMGENEMQVILSIQKQLRSLNNWVEDQAELKNDKIRQPTRYKHHNVKTNKKASTHKHPNPPKRRNHSIFKSNSFARPNIPQNDKISRSSMKHHRDLQESNDYDKNAYHISNGNIIMRNIKSSSDSDRISKSKSYNDYGTRMSSNGIDYDQYQTNGHNHKNMDPRFDKTDKPDYYSDHDNKNQHGYHFKDGKGNENNYNSRSSHYDDKNDDESDLNDDESVDNQYDYDRSIDYFNYGNKEYNTDYYINDYYTNTDSNDNEFSDTYDTRVITRNNDDFTSTNNDDSTFQPDSSDDLSQYYYIDDYDYQEGYSGISTTDNGINGIKENIKANDESNIRTHDENDADDYDDGVDGTRMADHKQRIVRVSYANENKNMEEKIQAPDMPAHDNHHISKTTSSLINDDEDLEDELSSGSGEGALLDFQSNEYRRNETVKHPTKPLFAGNVTNSGKDKNGTGSKEMMLAISRSESRPNGTLLTESHSTNDASVNTQGIAEGSNYYYPVLFIIAIVAGVIVFFGVVSAVFIRLFQRRRGKFHAKNNRRWFIRLKSQRLKESDLPFLSRCGTNSIYNPTNGIPNTIPPYNGKFNLDA